MLPSYVLTALSFLLVLLLSSRLLRERRAPGATLAWLLAMILIPYVGVGLFLALGGRKLKKIRREKDDLYTPREPGVVGTALRTMSALERMLHQSGVPPRSNGNTLDVLPDGETTYVEYLSAIRGARRTIHLASFILTLDATGMEILTALEERARAGVEVRLLLDGLGSFWTFRYRLRALRAAGGRIAYFLPLFHVPFFGHSNLRNHRKLLIVDERVALLGGMNLALAYLGPTPDPKRWTDLDVKVSGPVLGDLVALFCADWEFASGEELARAEVPESAASGSATLQVIASGPDVVGDPLYDAILSAIFDAKERIWIATPYFIPDDALAKALEISAKRGVEVRLIIPRRSNHSLADLSRGAYLRQFVRAGGHIEYFQGAMLHAKTVIVDDQYAVVGSANFDMRSLLLNFEVCLVLYSRAEIDAVGNWFRATRAISRPEPLATGFGVETLEGIGRLIGGFL